MLRTQNLQPSIWEALLPEVALALPAELAVVDELLDDASFWEPYVLRSERRPRRDPLDRMPEPLTHVNQVREDEDDVRSRVLWIVAFTYRRHRVSYERERGRGGQSESSRESRHHRCGVATGLRG